MFGNRISSTTDGMSTNFTYVRGNLLVGVDSNILYEYNKDGTRFPKKTVDGVVYMKKYFVGLPVVLIWFAMSPICIFCFLLCVNEFLWFGIIAFLSIPLIIGIILITILCQYVIIDEKGITKYNILGQIVLQFDWNKIKEIRIDTVWIYVSPWLLANEKKHWNASHLIVFIYSEKIMRVLKQYVPDNITTNFESKGQR